MPICAPRTRRSTSGSAPIRSMPSKRAVPLTCAPRVRPAMVCVATLLPEPDSPTMASVLPRSTSKESPRTAWTTPSAVLKATLRSRTSRSAMAVTSATLLARGEPHVRGVELLEGGDVDRVHHLGRPVVRGDRVGDREEDRVVHDLVVGLGPQDPGFVLGLGRRGLLDQRVRRRAVVEAEVAADRREGRLAEVQRLEEGQR